MVLFILSLIALGIPWLILFINAMAEREAVFVAIFIVFTAVAAVWICAWIFGFLALFVLSIIFVSIITVVCIILFVVLLADGSEDGATICLLIVAILMICAVVFVPTSWAGRAAGEGVQCGQQMKIGAEYRVLLVDPEGQAASDGRYYLVLGFEGNKSVLYCDSEPFEGICQGDKIIKTKDKKLLKIR